MAELLPIKLGGSLITDKRKRESVRRTMLARISVEIAAASARTRARLILGHGGGSFGHAAASKFGLNRGKLRPEQVRGVSNTQDRAAALHRIVIGALQRAGLQPFSLAPSSMITASAGKPAGLRIEPLELALELGVTPVVYGDVVLDKCWGASVCSTEAVFVALARRLLRRGHVIRRILWFGETEGIYDDDGKTVPRIAPDDLRRVLASVRGARGADVTGGMVHRLRAAATLAGLGIESWILDGRVPGRLADAVAGRKVPGTRVGPARSDRGKRRAGRATR